MAISTVACCNAIFPELLNKHNYEHWRSRVETYLLAEDLWDVFEAEPPRPDAAEAEHKAWTRKNAKALHAIKNSCGADMFSFISKVRTAKEAWEVLEEEFKSRLMLESEERERQQRDTIMEVETTIDGGQALDEDLQALQSGPHQQPLQVLNPGENNDFNVRCIALSNYVRHGDWDNAHKCLLELESDAEHALRARDSQGNTVLHLAVVLGHVHIVKELVQLMTEQDLEIKNNFGNTPLGILIRDCGVKEHVMIEMARYMVEKNNALVTIPVPVQSNIPVVEACNWSKWELCRYLYSVTPPHVLMPDNGPHGAFLFSACLICMKMLDMAFNLLTRCPALAIDAQISKPPMLELANTRAAFLSGTRLTCWQKWIYNRMHIKAADLNLHDIAINIPNVEEDQHKMDFICSVMTLFRRILKGLLKVLGINNMYEMKLKHCQILEILQLMSKLIASEVLTPDQWGIIQKSMSQAIEKGHVEFVTHIVKENKNCLYIMKESITMNMFCFAVESRQEKIYSLIYSFSKAQRNQLGLQATDDKNTMLHIAGSLSPLPQFNHIQDASLKMQRELQWFKEVESIIPAEYHDSRNALNLTARELFIENHKNLKVEAETSMKGTATSCTVVGALIVTMMFAAAFTVPGGNNGETGIPVFIDKKLFMVFIVSDIISLISSTTSVIIFLGILTSRYAEDDFLKSLPTKMMIGLFTLFLAIATMMVTFSSGLIIILHGKYSWIVLQSILVASLPVSSFVWMQFPLLIETFISTYGPGIFDRKVKPWF